MFPYLTGKLRLFLASLLETDIFNGFIQDGDQSKEQNGPMMQG
jgi:hypothetical protein